MKRSAFIFLSAILTCSTPAFATADGPDHFGVGGVTSNDVLFLREKPSAKSAKVGYVPHDGKRLENRGCVRVKNGVIQPESDLATGEGWCKVGFVSKEGWAAQRFLREHEEREDTEAAVMYPEVAQITKVASAVDKYPKAVGASIAESKEMCEVFKPGKDFASNRYDLNNDGIKDWMLDYSDVSCDGMASTWCGSSGCLLEIIVSKGNGFESAYSGNVQEYKVKKTPKGMVIDFALHGSVCNKKGFEVCSKVLNLNQRN